MALRVADGLQAEHELEAALEPLRGEELALAERQLERAERDFAAYGEAFKRQLEDDRRRNDHPDAQRLG